MAPASTAEGGATTPNEFGRAQVTLSIPHPGENAKLHIATQWVEAAERVLAKAKLLEPARGGIPATAEDLVDYPLDVMMPPAAGDQRAQLEWIKLEVHNEKNRKARESALLDAWTQIYLVIEESLQAHAPNLARELRDICDLQKRGAVAKAGYYDGPLAWQVALAVLPKADGERTKLDKDFYSAAEALQIGGLLLS